MNTLEIFLLQFLMSIGVVGLLARWIVQPWLERKSPSEILFWLTVPHAFRHLGLVFLVPGVVSTSMAESFSSAAGYGDLAAALLAILTLIALRKQWRATIAMAWTFNLVGTLDLANALRHVEVVPEFQAAWYIPTFVVPLLLVTHFMSFAQLLRMQRKPLVKAGATV